MDLVRKFYGKNICFYYYGEDHLVVNLYKYIKQNIENNIFIYLYINKSVYNLLLSNLDSNEQKMIRLINMDKEVWSRRALSENNSMGISENIKILKKEALDKGFWGITIITDATKLLDNSCSSIFEDFLKNMSVSCEKDKFNILTCYDFIDYIGRGKLINDQIMKLSYSYHSYRMFGNEIIPVENFILDHNAVENKA